MYCQIVAQLRDGAKFSGHSVLTSSIKYSIVHIITREKPDGFALEDKAILCNIGDLCIGYCGNLFAHVA